MSQNVILKKSGKLKEVITKCDNLKMAVKMEVAIYVLQINHRNLQTVSTKSAPPLVRIKDVTLLVNGLDLKLSNSNYYGF